MDMLSSSGEDSDMDHYDSDLSDDLTKPGKELQRRQAARQRRRFYESNFAGYRDDERNSEMDEYASDCEHNRTMDDPWKPAALVNIKIDAALLRAEREIDLRVFDQVLGIRSAMALKIFHDGPGMWHWFTVGRVNRYEGIRVDIFHDSITFIDINPSILTWECEYD